MFGSIYIGLSGLSAYSQGLKTVSNNVSNLNTSGFKSSDVTFADVYGAGSIGGLQYGANPSGNGHGVSLSNISVDFTQGELRQTGRDLDLAVDGSGFFVLLDGDQTFYTRTGSFLVNDEGDIVLAGTDYKLAVLDEAGRPVALNIDKSRTSPPAETTKIEFADNLSSTATEHTLADVAVYDDRGEEALWTIKFTREETVFDEWTVTVTDEDGNEVATDTLKFIGGTVDPTTSSLTIDDGSRSVELDFSNGVTSFSSGTISTLRAADVDGHPTGSIATLTINETGHFELAFTNEETTELGAIALADFRDPQRLVQRSGGLFVQEGYGQVQYLASSDNRVGSILSGRLEASNVDLGNQFGDLILIQRGFQASSQVISVTNDMIQQLFGIRGQG